MIATLRLALAAFGGAGLVTKLIVAGSIAAAALTAYGVWHHHVWRNGYDRAIADIAAADSRAIGRAKDARARLRDCTESGKRWDQSTGRCS
jgi:hypothetical protein